MTPRLSNLINDSNMQTKTKQGGQQQNGLKIRARVGNKTGRCHFFTGASVFNNCHTRRFQKSHLPRLSWRALFMLQKHTPPDWCDLGSMSQANTREPRIKKQNQTLGLIESTQKCGLIRSISNRDFRVDNVVAMG